jgi:colanic acid/amylovoran biosynthesis glycosyltransferase
MQILAKPNSGPVDAIDTAVRGASSGKRPPLKLAYLASQYPAVSHTFIFNEIRELRKLGFEISTASINACDRPVSQLPEIERAEQAATYYVKPSGWLKALQAVIYSVGKNPLGTMRGLLFTIRLGKGLKRFFYFIEALMIGMWMRGKGLEHLHVHFGSAAASVGMIVAKTFPLTYSLTIHGPDEFYEVSNSYLPEKIITARFVCCIGSYARSQVMKVSPSNQWKKIEVAPLGVDPVKFAPERRPATVPFEILCIARLASAKGHHILLSAVKRLVEENRAVRLRLLGDGPERGSLERRIAEEGLTGHVILEGAVNQDRIPGFLKKADVFALASFAEGVPVSLMEAMASEIPCVSTLITGIPELIRDEIDGLLVSPSDEEALADALRRLMDEPELRKRLGRAGRLRVMDRYNLERNVSALAEVYYCHLL